ncbi:hypothetical protein DL96DRAFT_657583 [Flagelloscypha sp. PMI_526]|nr:hypothetical protein DL96DRAFT_657583 [Flagelloscypha sp. PMI_526]
MQKNRFLGAPSHLQQTAGVSPARTHTKVEGGAVSQEPAMAPDDEDPDICPVCDGICTCNSTPAISLPPPPVQAPSTSSTSPRKLPSLKIKLTLPSKPNQDPPSSSPAPLDFYHPVLNPSGPKRRGRPPKALVAARQAAERAAAQGQDVDMSQNLNHQAHSPDLVKRKVTKSGGVTKSRPSASISGNTRGRPPKHPLRKPKISSTKHNKITTARSKRRRNTKKAPWDREDSASVADSTDLDDSLSGRFPTFVSASALTSSENDSDSNSSSSSSSSSSGFDTDSSMEAEEEDFIRTNAQNKARVRRELLGKGNDDPARKLHRKSWVIRPRNKSVGLSDVDMASGSSDPTEDEDEARKNNEETFEEDEDEETDGLQAHHGYVGLVTGWSEDEDEDDGFDAELFFANLDEGSSSSASLASDDEDGDQSDFGSMSVDGPDDVQPLLPAFEVTQGWDGRLVFTNGPHDVQDEHHRPSFRLNDAIDEPSPSPSLDDAFVDSSTEVEEDGYEQDAELVDADGDIDGDTTDEELIGADNRPNERAMRLFNFPSSISAINPLSTMSPVHSPPPRGRKRSGFLTSPGPAEILAGQFSYESPDFDDDDEEPPPSSLSSSMTRDGPRRGHFEFDTAVKHEHAVIGPHQRHASVPSPHARAKSKIGRGRGLTMSSSVGRHDELHRFLRNTLFPRPSSVPAPEHRSAAPLLLSPPTIYSTIPFDDGPTSEAVRSTSSTIDLDDMIDSSLLSHDDMMSESEENKNLSLHRWDFISVGAFRQTRDSADSWGSDSPSVIKSNPLSAMLWQNKDTSHPVASTSVASSPSKPMSPLQQKRHDQLGTLVSPMLLPATIERDGDGDRTPTRTTVSRSLPNTPKNKRHERKLKRKFIPPQSASPKVKNRNHHPHHQHHQRQHHPNSKTRGSSALQRTGSGGIPPLNL